MTPDFPAGCFVSVSLEPKIDFDLSPAVRLNGLEEAAVLDVDWPKIP